MRVQIKDDGVSIHLESGEIDEMEVSMSINEAAKFTGDMMVTLYRVSPQAYKDLIKMVELLL